MSRVIIKVAARADVLRQIHYLLALDAESAATRFVGAFQRALRRISQFPGLDRWEDSAHLR